jgi:acyl carrier protein
MAAQQSPNGRSADKRHGVFWLDTRRQVAAILDEVLSLNGRASQFGPDTPLLGAVPELDSMAVVTIITTLEDRFGFVVDDDEIDGTIFETFGALVAFADRKIQ